MYSKIKHIQVVLVYNVGGNDSFYGIFKCAELDLATDSKSCNMAWQHRQLVLYICCRVYFVGDFSLRRQTSILLIFGRCRGICRFNRLCAPLQPDPLRDTFCWRFLPFHPASDCFYCNNLSWRKDHPLFYRSGRAAAVL